MPGALVETGGYEVGVGPGVVAADQGMARSTPSITMKDDVHALAFGQEGSMAGVGPQGNEVTRLDR